MNDLYGDESCGSKIVSYGFVLAPEEIVSAAESALAVVKREFGSTPETELHCSRIFGPTARSKSEWAHLTNNDVYELYTKLFQRLGQLPVRKIAPYGTKDEWRIDIKGAPWQHRDPNFIGPMPWCEGFTMSDKHIAAFCAKMALTEIAKTTDLRTLRLWADPDKTSISLAGQRRQASRLIEGFFEVPSGLEEVRAMD